MDSARILVVEDERHAATNIANCLKQLGHDVVGIAVSGSEAVRLADQTRPDLALMDIVLDGLEDGISTAAHLRSELNIPVVYMTAYTNEAIIQRAKLTEPLGYLPKPFDDSSLGVAIEMALYRLRIESERERILKELDALTSELRDANARLELSAIMDPLTEVYNRRGLQHILSREIQLGDRKKHSLIAAIVDIDDFKKINDTLGHLCGDIVLKEVTKRIKESLRISDYVGRIGGDEFLLLLPETTLEDGSRLAERLRLSVAGMHMQVSETTNARITVSIGLAQVTNQTISIADIIGLTDHLLQQSKSEGKNQLQIETSSEGPVFRTNKLRYRPDYALALRRSELFYATCQGIRDLHNEAVIGVEFLSRMMHDSISMPNDFFRAALENNIVTMVDHHCFNACVKASSETTETGIHHINILPSTIMDAPIEWLVEKLSRPDRRYCLEICEQQGVGNSIHFKDAISLLKKNGIEIAIDDVGFGNTCLETILLIEPGTIKIDKKCVIGISADESMKRTLRQILKIGQDLNARVIAEGIETRQDLETLLSLGVKYGQGCHWGEPP